MARRRRSCAPRCASPAARASSSCTTADPSPAHERREAHEDRVDVTPALQAEERAAVVDQVELDVAAAPAQLRRAIRLRARRGAAPLDDRDVGGEEGRADLLDEVPVLAPAQVI